MRGCPTCGTRGGKRVWRKMDGTIYRECPGCGAWWKSAAGSVPQDPDPRDAVVEAARGLREIVGQRSGLRLDTCAEVWAAVHQVVATVTVLDGQKGAEGRNSGDR